MPLVIIGDEEQLDITGVAASNRRLLLETNLKPSPCTPPSGKLECGSLNKNRPSSPSCICKSQRVRGLSKSIDFGMRYLG